MNGKFKDCKDIDEALKFIKINWKEGGTSLADIREFTDNNLIQERRKNAQNKMPKM